MTATGYPPPATGNRHDRGFSLIEAMVASVIMLIGLLGLAGLQIVGMRANNLGKRMSQGSMLAQDLAQNMQTLWAYTDARLTPRATLYTDPNAAAISQYWDLTNVQQPTSGGGSLANFQYTDAPNTTGMGVYADNVNQLATYSGVLSPVDTSLPAAEQIIFTRYWNVYAIDLSGVGSAQGKLIQIVVRWKEPNFGYRTVTHSFFKYDPSQFNQ